MSRNPHGDLNEASIGKQAVSVLTRLGLDLTPANFHVVSLLLRGTNPDLKQRFLGIRRPLSQADLTELARQYLPFLFEPPQRVAKTLSLAAALPEMQASLLQMQAALGEFEQQMVKAQTVLAAVSEPLAPSAAHMLDLLSQSTAVQATLNADFLRSVSHWLQDLQSPDDGIALLPELDGQEAATADPDPAATNRGLGERAALMGRLQALHSGEQHLNGYSLMLCRVTGFDAYRGPVMEKARDFLLDTFGQQTSRLIGKQDSACWMANDEMALLLNSNNEIHLVDMSQRLKRMVEGAVGGVRRMVKDLPALACRFGCATAFGPASPAQLYGSARIALQRAELTEDEALVINAVSPSLSDRRYPALYGNRYH